MKRLLQRLSTAALLLPLLAPVSAHAATVTMSVNLSSGSVTQGSDVTATVKLSLGSNNTLDALAHLNYDSSKLQYVSASYAPSSSWASPGPDAGHKGSYYLVDVFTNGAAKSGNLDLVNVTFKALASSGSTSISLSNTSVSDGSVPPPTPPAPYPEHTVTTQAATLNFTAQPTPASGGNNTPAPAGAPTEAEQQTNAELDDDQPVPANGYADPTGYEVDIVVLDKEGNKQPKLEVKLGEQTTTTDDNGVASFSGVTVGNYTVTANGTSLDIQVVTSDPAQTQGFTLILEDNMPWLKYLGLAAATATVVVALAYGLHWLRNRPKGPHGTAPNLNKPKEEDKPTLNNSPSTSGGVIAPKE